MLAKTLLSLICCDDLPTNKWVYEGSPSPNINIGPIRTGHSSLNGQTPSDFHGLSNAIVREGARDDLPGAVGPYERPSRLVNPGRGAHYGSDLRPVSQVLKGGVYGSFKQGNYWVTDCGS
jgi:hypothetical protein